MYELVETMFGNTVIKMTDEAGNVWDIPEDPANKDYQAYLASLEETA